MRAVQGDRERGSATVLVLAVVAVIGVLMMGLGLIAGAQAGRATAQTAADLAALAAADAAAVGLLDDACQRAGAVVQRNGAELLACSISEQGVADVEASRAARFARVAIGPAVARARAGPAWLRDAHRAGGGAP